MRTTRSAGQRPTAAGWRRRAERWRRPLAALLLAGATALVVHAVLVAVSPAPGARVVLAARDLPAGRVLSPRDLRAGRLPTAAVPRGAVLSPAGAAGRVLAAPLRRGEALTDARLTGTGLLSGARAGTLAVPVAVDGPLPAGLIGPGNAVAVLAGPADGGGGATGAGGQVVVARARVLLLQQGSSSVGLLGGASAAGGSGGAVVVLALDAAQAARVAGTAGDRQLTLALLG